MGRASFRRSGPFAVTPCSFVRIVGSLKTVCRIRTASCGPWGGHQDIRYRSHPLGGTRSQCCESLVTRTVDRIGAMGSRRLSDSSSTLLSNNTTVLKDKFLDTYQQNESIGVGFLGTFLILGATSNGRLQMKGRVVVPCKLKVRVVCLRRLSTRGTATLMNAFGKVYYFSPLVRNNFQEHA